MESTVDKNHVSSYALVNRMIGGGIHMIELCFSESTYGSLRAAPRRLPPDVMVIGEGTVISRAEGISDEEYEKRCAEETEKHRQRVAAAIPFETTPLDIYYLDFNLSVGDITQPVELPDGPRERLFAEMRNSQDYEEDSKSLRFIKQSWDKAIKSYEGFKERIQNDEAVRIWLDTTPNDLCGFLFAMELLSDVSSKVSVIVLPKVEIKEGSVIEHSSWGEIEPLDFYKYSKYERELPKELIQALAWKWSNLKKENAPLRVVINGNIVSVQEDFYDSFIRQAFPSDESTIIRMISDIIANQPLFLSDSFITNRIKKMLANGELVYRQELEHDFYHSIIAVNK